MPNNNWNTSLYDKKLAFVFEDRQGLILIRQPHSGELILDLGCGTGHLTKTIAESGAHSIVIDSSAIMDEAADATYPDLEFLVANARDFSFSSHFDMIFSNATLHWIAKAEQVVHCLHRSVLEACGRLVVEFGRQGNVVIITTAIHQAFRELTHIEVNFEWCYPSTGKYASLL